jgi:mono/diheme cytochrome c family protein
LARRELEILQRLVADPKWSAKTTARDQFLGGLARCVFTEGRTNRVNDLFRLAFKAPAWQQTTLVDAVASIAPVSQRGKAAVKLKPVLFTSEPDGFLALVNANQPALTTKLKKIGDMITWPGQPGYVPPPVVKPLNAEQQKQFETGRDLFASSCAACHQPHGLGQEGLAPPLADSEWALGSEQRLIRIALNGVRGPISVKGRTYELEMPGLGIFPDDQLAAILTYIRREWGHGADPITTDAVKAIRDANKEREEAWSEPELLKIK